MSRDLNKSMDALFPQVRKEFAEVDGREQFVYIEDSSVCRVCEDDTVDGRWNYCSERCRDIANAVQSMFLWDTVRERVLERDSRTCQECGLSRALASRAHWQIRERIDELVEPVHPKYSDHPGASYDRWRRAQTELRDRYDLPEFTNRAFHVDHITPLSQGGHPFDESNLQTLCRECHEAKTADENRSDEPQPAVTLADYMEESA